MGKFFFAGTLVASKQTGNAIRTYWRETVHLAGSREEALGALWLQCAEAYPQSAGFTNHAVSVFQVPDEIVLAGARYARSRLQPGTVFSETGDDE